MKRRLLCLLLVLVLLAACVLPASAASFTDISGHWAESYIKRVVSMGLFNGVTSTEFRPGVAMDRAMFVTVLGRLRQYLGGFKLDDWSSRQWMLPYRFTDVKSTAYYAPYLTWATLHGITNGTGTYTFSPKLEITREMMATMIANFLKMEGYKVSQTVSAPKFSDASQISSWARDSVTYLARAGILQGLSDGKGGVRFAPKKSATRAECAAVFCRLYDAIKKDFTPSYPSSLQLSNGTLEMETGKSLTLTVSLYPSSVTNKTVVWISNNSSVVKVNANGKLTAVSPGTARVYAMADRVYVYCTVTVKRAAGSNLAYNGMSYRDKCLMVYGRYIDGEYSGAFRTVYTTQEEALANQVSITVPVWTIYNGSKISGTRTFQIHKNLAATVKQIFQEIYDAPDKPPINVAGGWRWRSYEQSEHNMGTALDLNPNSNPYVYSGSDPYSAGFKPGEDPYSIPIGGTIDQIFAKYGFKRGIYWNSGNKDYMHYSFFGW